ncbi:DUF1552 domain-containing protein [Luteolibacter arcticus]|uniref:DUF1552 domain-containing protein n=1 Tax=Luteolibacter arcticus TaxID=1581411 RepID=A0ABT3GFG5_9BACT|nr:DUF1552 domain-containing protein [Luteolibacter arcticus]MCW1922351.1 DUF1552 domain-containing protein [Luteolibacter arcticus]
MSTYPGLTSRRGFLRGLGAAVGLPALEGFRPLMAAETAGRALATTASGAPLRTAFLYIPNGVNLAHWRPNGTTAGYKMGETFKPMEALREHFQIYTGFEQQFAAANGDGPGDHARGVATFLTSRQARKTAGSDINLGISIDQVAANAIGSQTRLPSLELSADGVRKSGSCDSGYSCAYQFNLSWRSENQPMTPESNARAVFERLFGAGDAKERADSLGRRYAAKKSMLDFIEHDAKALHRRLGRGDQQKLDEYLTGVREIEKQIEKTEAMGLPPDPGQAAPKGEPGTYGDHLRLMMDMMVLAFKTDSTRISTFLMAHDGSNRSFKEIGVNDGHHNISHHQGKKDNLEKIAKIDLFYMQQLAYFLDKMKNTEDVDGKSLLHNSMIVYGGCISDGDRHNHDDLPIVLAGNAGGAFKPGRHVELGENVPLANLYLRMMEEMGVKEKRFGDSTGVLRKV